MIRKLRCCSKYMILIVFILIFYNEYFSYFLKTYTWSKLTCKSNDSDCARLLFVADPQILGEVNENVISRWDCDRYIANTYSYAVSYFQPNVIIFLGDLMDEGSIATNEEYQRYLYRFLKIFNTQYPIQHIWLPGDNDIGGEDDRLTKEKIERYENSFQQPSVLVYGNLVFYKVNRLTYEVPKKPDSEYEIENAINIALSHLPLLFMPATYVSKVINVIHPPIMFSAHEHKSMVVDTGYQQENRHINIISEETNKIYSTNLSTERIYEYIIPTCSYRMGTLQVGYGAAVLDMKNRHLQYAVLWSPSRFTQLFTYILLIIIIFYQVLKVSTCWLIHLVPRRKHKSPNEQV